jgi:signal transduction histidine kinase
MDVEERIACERQAALALAGARLGHEINNQLMLIDGYRQLLELRGDDLSARREYIAAIAAVVVRLVQMNQQLMEHAGRSGFERCRKSAGEVIAELEARSIQLAGDRVASTKVANDLAGRCLDVDSQRLGWVCDALIENALEASPSDGRLELSAGLEQRPTPFVLQGRELVAGHYLTWSVQDAGPGIPTEIATHACEPWVTAGRLRKALGLGLARAWGLLGLHRGGLELVALDGRGTRATVWLPLVTAV